MARQNHWLRAKLGSLQRVRTLAVALVTSWVSLAVAPWAGPCAASPVRVAGSSAVDTEGTRHQRAPRGRSAPNPDGAQLDVALASGIGAGGASRGVAPLSRLAGTVFASTLALGYRWDPLFIGATVLGGLALPSPSPDVSVCPVAGMVCRAALFRYGLQARYYHRLPRHSFRPWLGLGFERELFELVNASRQPDALYAHGNQFDVRLGVDFATTHSAMAGSFFLDYAVGRFAGGSVLSSRAHAIERSSVHHWILFGGGLSWRL